MGAGVTVAGVAGAGAGNATSLELELVYVGPLNLWGGLALVCDAVNGRGLHSSTSQLNSSRVCHQKTPNTP